MNEVLVRKAGALRGKGEYGFVLMQYVDRSEWMRHLQELLPDMYIENLTDFNYGTCFTMFLNISSVRADLGTREFDRYLEEEAYLDRLEIRISAIAPYALCRFVRYTFAKGEFEIAISADPYQEDHASFMDKVRDFLATAGLTILDEDQLSTVVPCVSLEMRESNATVYHCLFEDGY